MYVLLCCVQCKTTYSGFTANADTYICIHHIQISERQIDMGEKVIPSIKKKLLFFLIVPWIMLLNEVNNRLLTERQDDDQFCLI